MDDHVTVFVRFFGFEAQIWEISGQGLWGASGVLAKYRLIDASHLAIPSPDLSDTMWHDATVLKAGGAENG